MPEFQHFFFGLLEKNGIKTHLIRKIDDTTMLARNLTMIPLEVIVRNIAAGSMVKNYPIEKGTPLNPPVIVIDFKDDTHHDPMLNDDLIYALKLATPEELRELKQVALQVNGCSGTTWPGGASIWWISRLEFGKKDGTIYVGDEISMDSMRLWDKKTGESLDKDVYRTGQGDVMTSYQLVAARIITVRIIAIRFRELEKVSAKKLRASLCKAGNREWLRLGISAIPAEHVCKKDVHLMNRPYQRL